VCGQLGDIIGHGALIRLTRKLTACSFPVNYVGYACAKIIIFRTTWMMYIV
jgi:hypothetical protein